jgi:hypothetical protein
MPRITRSVGPFVSWILEDLLGVPQDAPSCARRTTLAYDIAELRSAYYIGLLRPRRMPEQL